MGRNTSDFDNESWEGKPWDKFEKAVFRLQRRIYKASQEGNTGKVKKLQKLLLKSRSAAFLAVRQVTQLNTGKKTPGGDGKASLNEAERIQLVRKLREEGHKWIHSEARRVYIPKRDGDKRPLGISTMADRAWQAMIKLALEPAAEAMFHARSYGFRPGRSAWDAAQDIFLATNSTATNFSKVILELDIEKCFDRIDHKYLMRQVLLPPKYKKGIWDALKAGVRVGYETVDTPRGTPQGGVFSPLLANIALNGIEELGKCIRYADDMVFILQEGEARDELLKRIGSALQERGLKVKKSKTRLVNMADGFVFLGFLFKLIGRPATKSKRYPGPKWLEETKRKINHILKNPWSDEIKAGKIRRICSGVGQLNPDGLDIPVVSRLRIAAH